MAARHQPRLRRVLSRFKRKELPDAVWWLVGGDDTPRRGTKRDIVSSALHVFAVSGVVLVYTSHLGRFSHQENKVSEHAITELELKRKSPISACLIV